jgi:hypothetical protein
MKFNKKHLLYGLVPVFALALLAGSVASASTTTTNTARPNPFGKLAEAIATNFNLATSSVQAVIDETMAKERPADQNKEPRFDMVKKAVADGKLTQAQADLIYAKRAEIKTAMESYKSMTQNERETAMKTLMDSAKQWAKDNNIPVKHVMLPGGPRNGHGGERGENGTPEQADDSDAPTSSDTTTVTE